MREAAKIIAELGFDGLDINMGCPDKSIEKQGAGAVLIKNQKIAKEIIRAAKEGIKEAGKNIPVSVKTRIGWSKPELETWLPELLKENISALTIHARTRKELSLAPANWEFVKRAVEIRNEMKSDTLIIGNGDVKNLDEGRIRAKESGADGVMIGRGIFGNPWLFADEKSRRGGRGSVLSLVRFAPTYALQNTSSAAATQQKLKVMVEHTKLFEKLLGKRKNFAVMKKHFKAYVNGFDGAKELRVKLMETENAKEVEVIIKDFLKS